MTGDDYDRVAASCDRLLLVESASIEWIAHPWLHVLGPHPMFIERYEALLAAWRAQRSLRSPATALIRSTRQFLSATSVVARSILGSMSGSALSAEAFGRRVAAEGPRDVVIASWLIHPEHTKAEADFYFGDMQRRFAERGLRSVVLLRNQTDTPTVSLRATATRSGDMARALVPDALSPAEEVSIWHAVTRARTRMRSVARARTGFDRLVAEEAYSRMAPALVSGPLRFHRQLTAVLRALRPRLFVTLYEGHAWERCAWVAAHREGVLSVGYQMTVVWERSHSVRRSLGRGYDPDVIFTSGDITRQALDDAPALARSALVTYGSYRRPRDSAMADRPRGSRTVLVLPDGNETETLFLFDFAARCARLLPDVRFVLRTHPLLPFERVRYRVPGIDRPNIVPSVAPSIDEDLAGAGRVIYRGSSAVIAAVLAGLRPFYVARPGELEFDPLERAPYWSVHVSTVDEFREAYSADLSTPETARNEQWQHAREFCDAYLRPIDPGAIDAVLELTGS